MSITLLETMTSSTLKDLYSVASCDKFSIIVKFHILAKISQVNELFSHNLVLGVLINPSQGNFSELLQYIVSFSLFYAQ